MSISRKSRLLLAGTALAVAAAGIGYAVARLSPPAAPVVAASSRPVLYWYDPMVPGQHFDKPGKSPYMDMQLVAKYAGDDGAGAAAAGVQVSSAQVQRLGVRVVAARRGSLADSVSTPATVDFDQRDVAVIQAKAGGFVQRVYARAPGDIVARGARLVDLLVPEWNGAQAEYLAVKRTGDTTLANAARQRLLLLGMTPAQLASLDRNGRAASTVTITAPTGGVIKTLGVRAGMAVTAGQTLAEVNGLGTVWLNAAVPEAVAGRVRMGSTISARFAAFPGEVFTGRVTAILPEAEAASRTLTVRIELPNRGLRLRPGMFATVALAGRAGDALLVPSEAVIRTGTRTLVMLAGEGGRYRPAEVQTGRETGGTTEILSGLAEGEKVVASGQFLLDSEASLSGIAARPIGKVAVGGAAKPASAMRPVYETVGVVEAIEPDGVTFSHQPVPALQWPAMTMRFRVVDRSVVRGLKRGYRVRFGFDQPPEGPTLRRLTSEAAR